MSVTFYPAILVEDLSIDLVADVPEETSLNMANGNAAFVLDWLGLDTGELCGWEDGEQFLGRILLCEAIAPRDAGVPSHEESTPGITVVYGGRRPDYLHERLVQLYALADWCRARGYFVAWA